MVLVNTASDAGVEWVVSKARKVNYFSFFLSFFFFFKKEGVRRPDFFFFSLRGDAISVSVAFEVSPSPSENVRLPSVSSPLNV